MLGELAPLLGKFRVYSVDVIGQSVKTPHARPSVRNNDYGVWLAEVLDGLGLARAPIVALSSGGFVAIRLAAHAPERIERLALLVPAGLVNGSVWQALTKIAWPMLMNRMFPSEQRFATFAQNLLSTMDDDWLPYFRDAFSSFNAMKPAFAAGAALTLAMLPGCHRPPAHASAADGLTPVPAARYIVEAFARYPLVAFSEPRHGAGGTKEFLASLIREPGFAGTVQDVVVECGNARYQDVVDRYISGEPVARDQLKRAWEETTIASGMWLAPMYEAVLADVRAVNLTRPPSQRVRVLLGDPPIDWSVVRGPADEDMNDWRDAHFAWVVEQQVLKKKHKALIWIGGAHISRRVRFPESLIHLLDRRSPGSAFVVVAVDPTDAEPGVSTRLRRWPSLSAVTVRDTWLGQLEAMSVGMGLSTGTVQGNIDALVVWDPASRVTDEVPRIDDASPIAAELRRRRALAETTVPFRGGRIRFESGTPALTAESDAALRIVLAELQRDSGLTLLVKAFTDAREPDSDRLSLQRARAVVAWLTSRGIAPARLHASGCGSTRALWFGRTEEERSANRRAELVRASPWAACGPPSSFDFR